MADKEKDITDEKEEKLEEAKEEKVDKQEETEEIKEESKKLTCEERYAELNNKYIRLYSDFDNFRKRTIKEKADIISSASGDVIKDLLAVLDDFERAIVNNENAEEIETVKEGFKLIYNKMKHLLEQKGLEPMNAKGEVFDADKHEAITNIPVENDEEKGKVVDVIERGYNLHGKPLRYAKVVVGQ